MEVTGTFTPPKSSPPGRTFIPSPLEKGRVGCLFLVYLTFLSAFSRAQSGTDEQLAAQYYNNGEYEKAVVYYEKLFSDDKSNQLYYDYYINCLVRLKEYSKAEKTISRQYKNDKESLNYLVDLGFVYQSENNAQKAAEQYDLAIKMLKADEQQVQFLAGSFLGKNLPDYAIQAYLKGRKMFRGLYDFHMEIAGVYEKTGNFAAMADEYLNQVSADYRMMNKVEEFLQSAIGNNPNAKIDELLRTELLKREQKQPDNPVYNEMLIWLFIQQKDFSLAFIHAKALVTRFREDGSRIINLAKIAESNSDYDAAVQCYRYLIEKGPDNNFYITARMELLNVLNKKITSSPKADKTDLMMLEEDYRKTIDELGISSSTILLLKGYAHLLAFYTNKLSAAVKMLEDAVKINGASSENIAKCKLELADIYLFEGEVWEATLIYSQVEKAFKNDPIGHEAKFRNAKLSYYIGEFSWAQAQLDVLKASTSKLIANDAMELSLIISDNTSLDSTNIPLTMFSRADLFIYRNKDSLASLTLDSLLRLYPGHSLADDILFRQYGINMRKGNVKKAAELLEEIEKNYSWDLLADDALFCLAGLYETSLNDTEKAKELYQKLLTDFPGSLYVVEARKRFRKLRGDSL